MGQKLANGQVELELAGFPVVTLTEHGRLSDAERSEVIDALTGLVEGSGRHSLLLDLRAAPPLPDSQRALIAEALHRHADACAEKWAGLAVLVRTPLLENLPTGAFWVRVSPVQTKVFASMDEAATWVRLCLAKRSSGELPMDPGVAVNKRREA